MGKYNRKNNKNTAKRKKESLSLTAEQFEQFLDEYQSQRMAGFVHPSSEAGRLRSEWGTSESPLSVADVRVITNRAIAAYKSNTWLKSAVEVFRSNIVEKGIRPRPVIKNRSGEIDKKLCTEIGDLWDRFNDVAFKGNKTLYQKQHTMLTSLLVTGNCFIVKVKPPKKSHFTFGLKLKDTRHLDFSKDTFDKNKDGSYVKHGIKYNSDEEPTEYYFKDLKNAIPADRVIHVFYEDLSDDNMGMSVFLQSLPILYDIENIFKYQLLSTRATAGIALWIKKEEDDSQYNTVSCTPLRIIESRTKPEVIQGTSRVSQEIIPLIENVLLSVAGSFGLSKAALTRDSLKESFSGGRLRSLNDQLAFETFTKFFSKAALHQIYVWFLEDIIVSGKMSLKAAQYRSDPWLYQEAYWQGHIKQYIDPLDQVRTDAEKLKNRLLTYKDYFQSKGKDWKVELKQMSEEHNFMKELGLPEKSVQESIENNSEAENSKEDKNDAE